MRYLDGLRVDVQAHTVAAGYVACVLRSYGADVTCQSALDPDGVGTFLTPGASAIEQNVGETEATLLVSDAPVTDAQRATMDATAAVKRVVWITPWGLDEPWASQPATALTLQAAGGWMSAVGEPEREPLAAPGNQPLFMAGLWAAIAALRDADSPGLSVVSITEAVTATMIYEPVSYQYYDRIRQRVGNRFGATNPCITTLPVQDGYLGVHSPLHRQWVAFCELAGCPELATDERFRTNPLRAMHLEELDREVFLPWLSQRKRWDAYHEMQRAGIPASATPDLGEVLASPQLKARRAWETATTANGRQVRVPGKPAREVAASEGIAPSSGRPLRVVEMAMGWAGPLAGFLMASMGAEVLKIEGPDRYDWWRGARAPGEDTQDLFERSHVFNTVNRGKRGVTLDITSETGREQFLRLVEDADVVIENFQAGVMERHGLSWEVLSARNPSLIFVRQPAFGSDGPEATYRAFGNTIEGMSGLTSLIGYEGGAPTMMSNALGDPVSGLNATAALQAALRAREHDGKGRCIEVAQLEGFLPLLSEEFIAYQLTGELPERHGNARPGSAWAGVVRSAGDDCWVAIEAVTPEQGQRLDEITSRDPAAWTAMRSAEEVVGALLEAGIAASKVNNEADLVTLEMLMSGGFWEPIEREFVGAHLYPGLPIVADGERWMTGVPAPTLGQHTDEVLAPMRVL